MYVAARSKSSILFMDFYVIDEFMDLKLDLRFGVVEGTEYFFIEYILNKV